jgi:hypothetical protein
MARSKATSNSAGREATRRAWRSAYRTSSATPTSATGAKLRRRGPDARRQRPTTIHSSSTARATLTRPERASAAAP